MPTTREIIAAVNAQGSNATDLRDAAHEACHALQLGLFRDWSRLAIHKRLRGLRSAKRMSIEIVARAVEQIVCQRMGEKTWSIEETAVITLLEAAKDGDAPEFSLAELVLAIQETMQKHTALELAERVIALGLSSSEMWCRSTRRPD